MFIGCTETIVSNFGPNGSLGNWLPNDGKWYFFGYSCVLNSLSLMVCLLGAKLFGKTTTMVLGIVCISGIIAITSFFQNLSITEEFEYVTKEFPYCLEEEVPSNCTRRVNGSFYGIMKYKHFWKENLYPDFQQDCSDPSMPINFYIVFGVLFSSVTGIMAGANLSGELAHPGRSISRGTLAALVFTISIYAVMVVGTAATTEKQFLLFDCYYLNKISIWAPSITIGSFLLTFSASLSNLIGVSLENKASKIHLL